MLQEPLKNVLYTTSKHLQKLASWNIFTVGDLLSFFPRTLENTHIKSSLGDILIGEKNTLQGILQNFKRERTRFGKFIGKAQFVLSDQTSLEVIWFRIPYQLKNLELPKSVFLLGKITRNYGKLQIQNPEIHLEANIHVGGIRPVYPESPPITSKWLREKIHPLMGYTSSYKDFLPEDLRTSENLLPIGQAIAEIHFPKDQDSWYQAKRRLAFEELFIMQLRVIYTKMNRSLEQKNIYPIPPQIEIIKTAMEKLPFALTQDQKQTLWDISKDLSKDKPMHRLLQGDVGSGKTIVAFLSALLVEKFGFQFAILAPTEILAKQHFNTLLGLNLFPMGSFELLLGSTTEKNKKQIKSRLENNDLKGIIGTHAILTEDTNFHSLGLAVIDEQHRFGVKQRSILSQNGTHCLSMTATPIPRSMALTLYGDQDISIIKEKPKGRKPPITRTIADKKTQSLCYKFIDDQIKKSRQIFWVCPLIEESETLTLKNLKSEFQRISEEVFPQHKVTFMHGKMKPKDKTTIMSDFQKGEFDILMSTSVIEVGIDVPNASVIVIENAERFGLAQLHQFRGRIGRNDKQCYCFLMVEKEQDKNKARLQIMEKSHDGFYLSEMDLKLRGAGEVYGLKQSGLPDFKCADITDVQMIQSVRNWVEKYLEEDPLLENYPYLKKAIDSEEVYF